MKILAWIRLAIWPLIALIVLAIYQWLPYDSAGVERYYTRGIFALYRSVYDTLLGWLPIPMIYIVLGAIVVWLIYRVRRIWRQKRSLWRQWARLGLSLINLLSVLLVVFYVCWGFNYKRADPFVLFDKEEIVMTEDELYEEYERITRHLVYLRSQLGSDGIDWHSEIDRVRPQLQGQLEQVIADHGGTHAGAVHARLLYPRGSLLHWSTAGVYLPWAGEGHVDPGLHPITWPFTMTHEMSHGYGYTGEDQCNFWALLACASNDELIVQYSGYFGYWRYLRSNAYLANKERYAACQNIVSEQLIQDLKEVYEYSDRYKELLPALRDLVYDSYLKSHGISDGLKNYSRMIVLAHRYQVENGRLF